MLEDGYIVAIAVLLPLTASMVVFQVNPYHALVMRGVLGAVAALVYALFGAADVALTEALVGTMLSITLYAVAVRSSLKMRLGVLEQDGKAPHPTAKAAADELHITPLLSALRQALSPYHLHLEPVSYPDITALKAALQAKEIHTALLFSDGFSTPSAPAYHLHTRVQRLHDILQADLPPDLAALSFSGTASLPDDPAGSEQQEPQS